MLTCIQPWLRLSKIGCAHHPPLQKVKGVQVGVDSRPTLPPTLEGGMRAAPSYAVKLRRVRAGVGSHPILPSTLEGRM